MKITISCGGKFHAFHLAEELDKRGYLHKLVTTFYSPKRGWLPEFRRDAEQITLSKVVTNIIPEITNRSLGWNYFSAQIFDNWAKSKVDRSDILVSWSGFALNSLRKAKTLGMVSIVERCSSHIQFQKNILEEEYLKYGFKTKPVNNLIVQKELSEYSEADYISIPSSFVRQTFIDNKVSADKLIQVPYGVNISHFRKIPKEDNIFRVVFVGGLTLRKGIQYLLEAFSKLKLPNAELLLIGSLSAEIKPFLKKYEGCYKYIGHIPHLELYKHFSRGSVFVLPSIEEGMAYVILQAMACGLPVVCTFNTGGSDIVRGGKDGFVIPIRNVDIIKEKLIYLYENPQVCKAMGESALAHVSNNFTWNNYGDRIIEQYTKALKK